MPKWIYRSSKPPPLTSASPRHQEINEILARKICRDLEIPEPR